MAARTINLQTLYDFAVRKQKVDPWDLEEDARLLYKSVKVYGIEKTEAKYKDENGTEIRVEGKAIPDVVRAMAAFICTLYYRWNDNSGRLDQHFGLDTPMQYILGTKIFKRNTVVVELICLADVIENWTA